MQPQWTTYVNIDFSSCSFVFIRHDAVRKPLQPPYNGPFFVLQRTNKYFTLDISDQKKVVSLDCLKPAYLDTPSSTATDAFTSSRSSQSWTATSSLPPSASSTPIITTRSCHQIWLSHPLAQEVRL